MSEVNIYYVVAHSMSTNDGPGRSAVVFQNEHSRELDRVTAERDAALGRKTDLVERLGELRKSLQTQTLIINSTANARDALRLRLNEADEQIDALSTNLRFAEEGRQAFAEESDQLEQRHRAEFEACRAAERRVEVLEGLVGEVLDAVGREPLDLDAVLRLRARMRAALKPAEGGGDEYRKSCEVAHKALSMENQRIVAPGQFKCLACGDVHPGSGNLPCPKISPTA